ncbi:MAG: hypothetical protein LUF01_14335 [Bacteroides sp.]|nr:hypothetical protein [Bacteroides sp.]
MKAITIKRATTGGISLCNGELYEHAGFQFCITKEIDSNMVYAIELSTGLSAKCLMISEYVSQRSCLLNLKSWIRKRAKMIDSDTINRSKELLATYGMEYPLNERM